MTALLTVLVKLLCYEPLRPRCFVPCICFACCMHCICHHLTTVGVPTVVRTLHASTRDHCRCADSGFANALLTTVGVLTVVQRSRHGPKVWPQLAWPVVALAAVVLHLVGFDLHDISCSQNSGPCVLRPHRPDRNGWRCHTL